jgi:GLPGLI family protein
MFRILFLLISSLSFSQQSVSGVVEYTIESISSEMKNNITKTSKNVSEQKALLEIFSNEPVKFILEFNGNEAIYKNTKVEMLSDANQKTKPKFLEVIGGGSGLYFFDSQEKITLIQKSFLGELFLISSKFPEWKLTSGTKKIGSYICFKAKYISKNGNKNLTDEVWYTPEIPVQFGPIIYVGLPGLVLEVIAGKVRFTATKIQLNSKQPIVIEKPNKGTKITEEEYTKKLQQIGAELGF